MHNLTLTKRPATIGRAISTRTENHGDDEVAALTIPVSGILLDHDDLGRVLGDQEAHHRLFLNEEGLTRPAFIDVSLNFGEKFKGATVKISPENGAGEFTIKPATVSKIVLEPTDGGFTHMSCQILGVPEEGNEVDVLGILNQRCKISVRNGKLEVDDAQASLPLPAPELPKEPEEAGDEPPSRMARQISRGLAKKARSERAKNKK